MKNVVTILYETELSFSLFLKFIFLRSVILVTLGFSAKVMFILFLGGFLMFPFGTNSNSVENGEGRQH